MGEFRVGVTHDLVELGRATGIDAGPERLGRLPGVRPVPLAPATELAPEAVRGLDGLLLLKPRVSAATLRGADRLLVVARWGVGVDSVDVAACTRQGVGVTITPDGVRRPVAAAMLTLLLALAHNLVPKARLLRAGEWRREAHLGTGLSGRVLGLVGCGNIGRELLRLAAPLQMRHLVYDPYAPDDPAVERVGLEPLLRTADFVAVCCPLTAETRHLLDAPRLALMKPSACLLNLARGPIVDQAALVHALRQGRIRAAGLDVFDDEPLPADAPIRQLDNVLLTPHSLAWTDEIVRGNTASACAALADVQAGRVPAHLVDEAVLHHPRWRRLAATVPTQQAEETR